MPSFKYFATFDESMSILRTLFTQGFGVVGAPAPFDEPKAPEFFGVNEDLIRMMKITPNFYLRGEFTRFPVQFQHCADGPAAGKYLVDLLTAGPLMQAMISRVETFKGKPTLMPGTVSHQKSYKNPESGEWDGPSPELKEGYRKAVAAIKKLCRPIPDRPDVFIAPEARKLLENAEVGILA